MGIAPNVFSVANIFCYEELLWLRSRATAVARPPPEAAMGRKILRKKIFVCEGLWYEENPAQNVFTLFFSVKNALHAVLETR